MIATTKKTPVNITGTTARVLMIFGRFITTPTTNNIIPKMSIGKVANIHNSAFLLSHPNVGSKLPNQRLETALRSRCSLGGSAFTLNKPATRGKRCRCIEAK